ncbi:MAG TPA: peptidylprolyl isomerase [Blastocatellia bacterium]|nr:peptidylprolyl isomerase [Blastocatellia bacterium]
MRIRTLLFSTVLAFTLICSASCGGKSEATDDEVMVLETSYGRIVIEFLPKDAPRHTEHYKALAKQGFYDGTRFHRLLKDKREPKAIQGGDPNTVSLDNSTWGKDRDDLERVPAEFSKTLTHRRSAVSAARKQNDENSATSQFFICADDVPEWDGVYSIFGRVIDGMKVVDLIARAPVFPNSDMPLDAVVINKAYVIKRSELK